MKKWIAAAAIAIVWLGSLCLAYGFGALIASFTPGPMSGAAGTALSAMMLLPGGAGPCDVEDTTICGFQDTEGREELACDIFAGDQPERAVLFAFGQSNSANAARDRYVPLHDVVNFNPHDGKCYRAEDPLLGPNGEGGSVWGRVGDELIREGLYRQVLIVPVGIGGTALARWVPGADLHARVDNVRACSAGKFAGEFPVTGPSRAPSLYDSPACARPRCWISARRAATTSGSGSGWRRMISVS